MTVYASTRRHVSLKWSTKAALRLIPIVLFATQILTLLRAIRCQTSPEYSTLRYGRADKHSSLDYAGEGGFLYDITSVLLGWESDQASCSAASMGRPIAGSDIPYGSFSLLWPAFIRLCLGHFIETLSSALQGRTHAAEGGMSIFEHSLAFAEAETMISQSIGLGLFGIPKSGPTDDSTPSTATLLSRSRVLERLNVTPELLLITLISCCNGLSANILDVLGKQAKYRFIHTTLWALCYMGAMFWGIFNTYVMESDAGVLNFPTVCIVGFVPHLLMLIGILACVAIYCVALVLTALSLPSDLPQPTSFRERFALANGNMQGSSHIENTRFNLSEDFYSTLVRIGYASLTAASEAVFLNEGKRVVVRRMTWLEEDRLTEIADPGRSSSRNTNSGFEQSDSDGSVEFELPKMDNQWQCGYAQEKKLEKKPGSTPIKRQSSLGSVGAFRNPNRGYQGFLFLRAIFNLTIGWWAFGLIRFLEWLRFPVKLSWLESLAGTARKTDLARKADNRPPTLDFWILTDEGVLELPENHDFDVEKEMRKREKMIHARWGEAEESQLDNKLYNWWKAGGSWGNQDDSGDYSPPEEDWDDTTSVISASTNNDEWESDESDGRKTPTQDNPYPLFSRFHRPGSPAPETLIDTASLARLLDPKDRESKREAQILSSHLLAANEGRIVTRSHFKQQIDRERARILTSTQYIHSQFLSDNNFPSPSANNNGQAERRLTSDEEAELLEKLILSRRLGISPSSSPESQSNQTPNQSQSWATGASGLGPEGPLCVVCQASPRAIITWPCRCLCICEDCRFSLAMNNFGSCVTCRREVTGFVRLWVP